MPRTALTVEDIDRSGLNATQNAVDQANGNEFTNTNQDVFIRVENNSGGNLTVTIPTSITVDGEAVADKTVVIANTEFRYIGPFLNSYYGNGGTTVHLDWSTGTSVTCEVMKLGSL